MIQTVNGNVEELGITMSHEHIMIDLRRVRGDQESYILEEDLAVSELLQAKELGVNAIIELTCNDMGRDVKKLKEISIQTGVHIICATGFYIKDYHTDLIKHAKVEEIEEIFIKELQVGIEDTQIKAGIIGEIGYSRNESNNSEEKVLRAAGRASIKTKACVSTHCDMGLLGKEQLRIMQNTGMNSDKIILGHTDLVGSVAYQVSLLESGVNLAFDTIGKTSYLPDEKRAEGICRLLDKGYGDKILLSQDVSRRSYLRMNGGAGYCKVMESFIPLLFKMGVSRAEIDKMLIDNPRRILEMGN
ncbi:MAG: phosphotriesterase [Anaerocolumna sp.]